MVSEVTPAQRVVVCQQVTRIFRDFWMRPRARAVENLTFEINRGEVFGLLGPNGSGKSTTIKMILGLLRPTRGRIALFGKQPTDVAVKKRIGYLPEESYLYPFLNARETLDYYGKLFNLDPKTRARRTDELLDMVGLAGAQHRPVREYSKGMQRRIGLAQALINDPEFLILDEPTTGLDPIGTRQVKDLIIELGRRGKTILLSSHLLADVEDCVSRMIILYGGQKREEGTCETLLERRERVTIESEPLDDALIAEIDRLIRARTNGTRSILSVAKPRQKLEELFLAIVERARAQQVSTSGATAGGETAAFLRGDQGTALIDQLVRASQSDPAPQAPVVVATPPAPTGPDVSVIETLVKPEAAPAPTSRADAVPSAPAAKPDVDSTVIDSLLSPPGGPGGGARKDGSAT
mgnify:CR=1 FL=1